MNNAQPKNGSSSSATMFIQGLIVVGGLIGLYYLYQYLFSSSGPTSVTLLASKTNALTTTPIKINSANLPPLYEGGEFSVSMWVYVQNWNYRSGFNKSILNIGGSSFDTIRIYLAANKAKLHVRLHTKEGTSSVSGFQSGPMMASPGSLGSSGSDPGLGSALGTMASLAPSSGSGSGSSPSPGSGSGSGLSVLSSVSSQQPTDNLDNASRDKLFTTLQTDSGLLDGDSTALCDLPEIDIQKWIQVAVAVNGKTVDIYMDGKLARSCVLPSFYKVDHGGYQADLLDYGGFGGYISSVQMYNYALAPNAVYNMYMSGPSPITNLGQYLASFFQPSAGSQTM